MMKIPNIMDASVPIGKDDKKVAETYAILAKKLGYNKDDFKTTLLDKAGIEVKDMRKKVPNKIKKQIIEVLS